MRQIRSDLVAYLTSSGRSALSRMLPDHDGTDRLTRVVESQSGCFRFPADRDIYGGVLLASALPDDDFPAFSAATAMLLLDRLSLGDGADNLYWNWEAFQDHFAMADPAIRALLMNAFRLGEATGRIRLPDLPPAEACLTYPAPEIVARLTAAGETRLAQAIDAGIDAAAAGRLWADMARTPIRTAALDGIRHLFQRPASLVPPDPSRAPLIPWSL